MNSFDDCQRLIDRGEIESALEHLSRLEKDSQLVMSEGLDYHDVTRCFLQLARAELLRGERRFDECRRLLRSIKPTVPMSLHLTSLIESNVDLQQGNLALHQGDPEEARQHYEKVVSRTASSFSPLLMANTLFNLGTCYRLTRQDERAISAFERSAELYQSSSAPSKVADAYHQIGNVLAHLGRLKEAGGFHMEALHIYMDEKNHAGVWMTGDDLSRVLYEMASEARDSPESETWLQQAVNYSLMAGFSAEQVWRKAQAEGRLADLSEQLLNHTMTRCELGLAVGETKLLLGTLARSKGKIRGGLVPPLTDVFPEFPPDLVKAFDSGAPIPATIAVSRSLRELTGEGAVVAVIDQIAVTGNHLLSGVYLCRRGQVELAWFESEPIESDARKSQLRSLRGNDRCAGALEVANRYKTTLTGHSQRCCFILGDINQPLSESDKSQLAEWATELASDGKTLGKWFFPDDLLAFLRENKVEHVVLIADPAFPTVPYAALETSEGYVIDQPWSLSIATSALELIRWAYRKRSLVHKGEVHWFGPDPHVNTELGGDEELAMLKSALKVKAFATASATCDQMAHSIAECNWVHFRGHGRWSGDIKTSGPVLYDGVLSRSVLESIQGTPSFVVTAACLTGFSEAIGSEVFGSLVDYDRANCIGAVLTYWPIHGPFTTNLTAVFYNSMAQGMDVARAIKLAAQQCRDMAPHPYLWAPFAVYGLWQAHEFLFPVHPSIPTVS